MARTLSEDLRVRVIRAVEEGLSCRASAERFGIGVATAIRWVRVWRETGETSAKPKGGDLRSQRIEAFHAVILAAVDAKKDITLDELSELLAREHGARFAPARSGGSSPGTASASKKTAHAAEQNRPDVAKRRQVWFEAQPDLDPERLVFIDETGASTKMARLRGLAARVAGPRFLMAIGKPRPSPEHFACPA